MGKQFVATIADEALKFGSADSDRFVYSNYFVPLELVYPAGETILPFYVKKELVEISASGLVAQDRLKDLLRQHGPGDVWETNEMTPAAERWTATRTALEQSVARADGTRPEGLRESAAILDVLAERLTGADREVATALTTRLRELDTSAHLVSGRVGSLPTTANLAHASVLESVDAQAELLLRMIRSDLGYVFLDRTRITPVGFALGEHVYALGLAPGEVVDLEQKTFTKREMSVEEATEQEKQFDIELASTYSTELQEGMEHQRSTSDSWGLNTGLSAQYSSPETPYGQITASPSVSYAKNASEASQASDRWSIKDSQTASSKVAAKYRAQHRTTFRLATENTFESRSKRTIRNPNATTPITLHYFKVMQRLRMKQERYGARLCWTIGVKDPGARYHQQLMAAHQGIIDEAVARLPEKPTEPPAPPEPNQSTATKRETKIALSPIIEADKWGLTGDMRAQYDADVPLEEGFSWDENAANVRISIFTKRPDNTVSRGMVGTPYLTNARTLRVKVGIGAPSWIGGPGISFQVSVTTIKDVTVTQQSSQDAKYADDLVMYRTALKEWEENRDRVLAGAQASADAYILKLRKDLNPINEMIAQIIDQHFPPALRDEMDEIDYWNRLFDWERATFVPYPAWWSGGAVRDPLLDPSDFTNASWAKLYLPAKLGMERAVLRWVLGKSTKALKANLEQAIDGVIDDLDSFRENRLGAAGEIEELTTPCQEIGDPHTCLGVWHELVPTDGTHLEIIQGASSAADAITSREIADAAAMRAALLERETALVAVAGQAQSLMSEPASVSVHVGDAGAATRQQT